MKAKALRFQDPERCPSIDRLWETLPAWLKFMREAELGGYILPDWVQSSGLDKLIPATLLKEVVDKPELAEVHSETCMGASSHGVCSW